MFSTNFDVRPREHGHLQFTFNSLNGILGNIDICSIRKNNDTLITMTPPSTIITTTTTPTELIQPKLHSTFQQQSHELSRTNNIDDSTRIITRCDRCNQCPQTINFVHDLLTKTLMKNLRHIERLYVIIDKSVDISMIQNNNVKFVYSENINTDKKITEICDNIPEPEGSDALRSFSKTSVSFFTLKNIVDKIKMWFFIGIICQYIIHNIDGYIISMACILLCSTIQIRSCKRQNAKKVIQCC